MKKRRERKKEKNLECVLSFRRRAVLVTYTDCNLLARLVRAKKVRKHKKSDSKRKSKELDRKFEGRGMKRMGK